MSTRHSWAEAALRSCSNAGQKRLSQAEAAIAQQVVDDKLIGKVAAKHLFDSFFQLGINIMKKLGFATLASVAILAAMPASAATVVFTSGFEGEGNSDNSRTPGDDPGVITPAGDYGLYTTADGWTADDPTKPIELQNNVAGAPSTLPIGDGGKVFVELDSTTNSSMSREIGPGSYLLSFLYSPRPGQPSSTNGIQVGLMNGMVFSQLALVQGPGIANTSWFNINVGPFAAAAGSRLTFRAVGNSDSLGGYVDNITLAQVPEPATWAMMIMGFGLVGGALRSAKRGQTTRVRFA
jgi:PEP-CTERM motif